PRRRERRTFRKRRDGAPRGRRALPALHGWAPWGPLTKAIHEASRKINHANPSRGCVVGIEGEMDQLPKDEERRRSGIDTNVAFALTVLPSEQALLRRARRLVGSDADARDLVQETLERALRTFHGFRPGTAVWAWLRTIMNSVWIDGWRRRQAAQKVMVLPVVEVAAPDAEPTPQDRIDTILERL